MLKFLSIVLFTVFTLTAYAATGANTVVAVKSRSIKNDTSKVSLRNFDQQKIKTYRGQAEFKYDDDVPAENLWDKFWKWFWSLVNSIIKGGTTGSLIKYVVIAILAGVIIFVLIKTAGLDLRILLGKSKPTQIPYTESHDNIHEIDFNAQLQQAINNGNYRLAVRLCYLSSLKKLSDQSQISWQPEKTNQTYIAEINDATLKKQFSLLTRQFEYIWYGEFFIDRDNFLSIKSSFDEFNPGKR